MIEDTQADKLKLQKDILLEIWPQIWAFFVLDMFQLC